MASRLNGFVLLFSAIAYFILTKVLIAAHGEDSLLAAALGGDFKGQISLVIYGVAIMLSFVAPWASCALYVLVAIMWLVPDRRIEKTIMN